MTQKELVDQFCKYRGKCTTDDVVALNFAYSTLAPHWTSVEEELPPKNEAYLAFWQHLGVGRYRFVKANEKVGERFMEHITHWMPLPALSCSDFPNNQERRVIGTADHIKTALDVMKGGGEG